MVVPVGNVASDTEMEALAGESIKPEPDMDANIKDAVVDEPAKEKEDEPPAEVPAKVEPKAEEKPKVEPAKDDYKAEIIKRFGEKPDEELVPQVWKSYREMEKEFDRRNVLTKEVLEVVDKFGGLDALKNILATPKENLRREVSKAEVKSEPELPKDIQELIDSGELDLASPKDQMFIRQELRLREQEIAKATEAERNYTVAQQEAVKQFETFLANDIVPKYEYADLNAIKAKAFAGAWRGLSDEAFKVAVENEAKALHDRVIGLAEKSTEQKIAEFRKVKEKSVVVGKSVPLTAKKQSFKEAFDSAYDENFGSLN